MVARVLGSSILSAWHTKNMWQVRSRAKIAKKKNPKPYSTSLRPQRSYRALQSLCLGNSLLGDGKQEGGAREGARAEARCGAPRANLAKGACRASARGFS